MIFFGFKSAGKTFWGRKLSLILNLPFIDTDVLIEEVYQQRYSKKRVSISSIYTSLGESLFRQLESEVIHHLKPSESVIAVGGGSVLDPKNVAHLQTIGPLFYLQVSFSTIVERLQRTKIPSFVDSNNWIVSLYQLYQERIPIYEKIPSIWIRHTDGI